MTVASTIVFRTVMIAILVLAIVMLLITMASNPLLPRRLFRIRRLVHRRFMAHGVAITMVAMADSRWRMMP